MNERPAPSNIDGYIAGFPPKVQAILKKIRATVRKAAPQADEKISYRMPAFAQNGILIYFAAFQKHIGVYPPVYGDDKLDQALGSFRGEKGNLKLPLDKPIPYGLIARLAKFRVKEQLAKARLRQKK